MTNKFKIGDKVRCIKCPPTHTSLTFHEHHFLNFKTIYEIKRVLKERNLIDLGDKYSWYSLDLFELIEEKEIEKEEFKMGDKVRCINDCYLESYITKGKIYIVQCTEYKTDGKYICILDNLGDKTNYFTSRFELVEENKMEKEEFKVDKLGWYEVSPESVDKKSDKFLEVLVIDNENVCARWNKCLWVFTVRMNGFLVSDEMDLTVTKYLGPELPKEPLKFEIESNFCTTRFDGKNILCMCGENEVNFEIPYNAIKKFKVTFEELPND